MKCNVGIGICYFVNFVNFVKQIHNINFEKSRLLKRHFGKGKFEKDFEKNEADTK